MDRTKLCFVYCGDGICDCGADDIMAEIYDVDYPCDVEPPYDEEVKNDTPNTTTPTEQSPTPNANTAG
jgi:hypothetical protein